MKEEQEEEQGILEDIEESGRYVHIPKKRFFYGLIGVVVSVIIVLFALIFYTPLKQWIPGYPSASETIDLIRLQQQADSMKIYVETTDLFLQRIQSVVSGNIQEEQLVPIELTPSDSIDATPTEKELAFRDEIEAEESRQSRDNTNLAGDILPFVKPIDGVVTESYDPKRSMYGIDILSNVSEPVKSMYNGTVIFAEYAHSGGIVVIVQHSSALSSVYKHLRNVQVVPGEVLLSGQVIGSVGGKEVQNGATHLGFEIWKNGYSVNPEDYFIF